MYKCEKHILRMCVYTTNETRAILKPTKYWATNMTIVHACPTTPMTRGLRERPLPKTIHTYSIVYSTNNGWRS